jgi:DNA-binding NtrC family response regulator
MMSLPADQRRKVPAQLDASVGPQSWVEIETKDDPRDPKRKIFLLYDITEVQDLRRMLDQRAHFQDMVGKSERMQRVYQQIRDLRSVDSMVLIEGETGTGKELVARAIHATGRRKDKPFLAVNCAGLNDSLLSSQLFGHRRGAFTGAIENQKGVFETATGGTVFLDEIGDISRNVQTSLLRVLQEKEITRVGEATPYKVDVRIIVATHQDLNLAVEEGRFRLDLLYRIRVARIELPGLRERREDIPLLAETFLSRFRATTGKRVEHIGEETMGLLLAHAWPGNVRELQSAIEFAVLRCTGTVIRPSDLPPEIKPDESLPAIDGADERSRIEAALTASKGNRLLAARLLGVSRSTLYRRLSEFQISNTEPQ